MSQSYDPAELKRLPTKERHFVESIEDEDRRSVVACSILRHRLPDTLAVGDSLPDLELSLLDGDLVSLRSFVGERPLLLVFGSYT